MIRKGSWIADNNPDNPHPKIAKVRDTYAANGLGNYADLVLYRYDGERIGRESPAESGPTTFEPSCVLDYWAEIREPQFPLERNGLYREWRSQLKFMEN